MASDPRTEDAVRELLARFTDLDPEAQTRVLEALHRNTPPISEKELERVADEAAANAASVSSGGDVSKANKRKQQFASVLKKLGLGLAVRGVWELLVFVADKVPFFEGAEGADRRYAETSAGRAEERRRALLRGLVYDEWREMENSIEALDHFWVQRVEGLLLQEIEASDALSEFPAGRGDSGMSRHFVALMLRNDLLFGLQELVRSRLEADIGSGEQTV